MTDMRDVESIRPTDAAIDAEFDAQRRESVFQQVQARTRVVPIRRSRRWPAAVSSYHLRLRPVSSSQVLRISLSSSRRCSNG